MSSSTVLGPVFTLVRSNNKPLYLGMESGTDNPRGVKQPEDYLFLGEITDLDTWMHCQVVSSSIGAPR